MASYNPIQPIYNAIKNNPFKTIGFAAALFCAYHIGKWERAREPLVERAVLLSEDLNKDGRFPDLAIQLLNGRREALYMQDDGSTLLSYPGMLKGYKEREAILNGPLKSDKPALPLPKPNPIDNPYIIPQCSHSYPQTPSIAIPPLVPIPNNNQPTGPAIFNPDKPHPQPSDRTAQVNNSNLERIAKSDVQPIAPLVPVVIPKQ